MDHPELAALQAVDPLAAMRLSATIKALAEQVAALGWAARQLSSIFSCENRTDRLDRLVALAQEAVPDGEAWAVRWSGDVVAGTASFAALSGANREIPPPGVISRSLVGRAVGSGKPLWMDDPARRAPESAASIVLTRVGWVGCLPLGNNGVLYLSGPPGTRVPSAVVRARLDALAQLAADVLDAPLPAPPPGTKPTPRAADVLPGMVGGSAPMRELARTVRAFSPMPWPALIRGETGTGKEAVARAFHALSPRKDGPFIAVNCATIPEELAESMLFGHERGAFTGADRPRTGVVEEAAGGTLFLDEIGELPARVQAKLLRLLQEGTYSRLGSSRELRFTGRIVGATLRALDESSGFREDLYHRLASCVVHTPPLRARREDIPELARHLLAKAAKEAGVGNVELEDDAMAVLTQRDWPGNVRELENALRSGLARANAARARTVGLEHLDVPAPAAPEPDKARVAAATASGLLEATEQFQRQMVQEALAEGAGNVARAAARLSVSPQWLYRLIARWGGKP